MEKSIEAHKGACIALRWNYDGEESLEQSTLRASCLRARHCKPLHLRYWCTRARNRHCPSSHTAC